MNIKFGDIVTYKDSDDYVVTHRIVDINENTFIAKGDSNNLEDESQILSNIRGKVIYHSKLLGFFVLYLLKPVVVIYIILFAIINLFFYKKEKNEDENEESEIESKETTISENIN